MAMTLTFDPVTFSAMPTYTVNMCVSFIEIHPPLIKHISRHAKYVNDG